MIQGKGTLIKQKQRLYMETKEDWKISSVFPISRCYPATSQEGHQYE